MLQDLAWGGGAAVKLLKNYNIMHNVFLFHPYKIKGPHAFKVIKYLPPTSPLVLFVAHWTFSSVLTLGQRQLDRQSGLFLMV